MSTSTSRWRNSTRSQQLPSGWHSKIRPRILKRDGHACQIRLPGCTGTATEVDHIRDPLDHDPANLQAACTHCNARKNILTRPKRPTMRRQPEQHPGLL